MDETNITYKLNKIKIKHISFELNTTSKKIMFKYKNKKMSTSYPLSFIPFGINVYPNKSFDKVMSLIININCDNNILNKLNKLDKLIINYIFSIKDKLDLNDIVISDNNIYSLTHKKNIYYNICKVSKKDTSYPPMIELNIPIKYNGINSIYYNEDIEEYIMSVEVNKNTIININDNNILKDNYINFLPNYKKNKYNMLQPCNDKFKGYGTAIIHFKHIVVLDHFIKPYIELEILNIMDKEIIPMDLLL